MAKCAFIKPGGDRCGARAMKGYETCYGHRPDLAEERKRNASRGGKRGGRERGIGNDPGGIWPRHAPGHASTQENLGG